LNIGIDSDVDFLGHCLDDEIVTKYDKVNFNKWYAGELSPASRCMVLPPGEFNGRF